MQLTLERVTQRVGAQTWLHEQSIAPRAGAVTVLLGATQAGKTSLMRLMAGLDRPTTGTVRVDGQDVTGKPVRERNVAMVYQQFINYPNLTVFENIASPLRVARMKRSAINDRVHRLAELLRLTPVLRRRPAVGEGAVRGHLVASVVGLRSRQRRGRHVGWDGSRRGGGARDGCSGGAGLSTTAKAEAGLTTKARLSTKVPVGRDGDSQHGT